MHFILNSPNFLDSNIDLPLSRTKRVIGNVASKLSWVWLELGNMPMRTSGRKEVVESEAFLSWWYSNGQTSTQAI
jgi:hypothetical protein